jgi:AbrB family looped-hinge helix DNA binding protein
MVAINKPVWGYIMADVSTTKMSSKGQVVIPESIRKQLKLKTGDRFVVVGEKDVVILKSISPPSLDESDDLIAEVRKKGKQAGIKKSDISDAISKARGKMK